MISKLLVFHNHNYIINFMQLIFLQIAKLIAAIIPTVLILYMYVLDL